MSAQAYRKYINGYTGPSGIHGELNEWNNAKQKVEEAGNCHQNGEIKDDHSFIPIMPKERFLKLNSIEDGEPLFIIPGIEGQANMFAELASILPCPVIGIQYTDEKSQTSIASLALYCIQVIQEELGSIENEGFSILAYSMGTAIAQEMVSIFQKEKKNVLLKHLIFLDGSVYFIKAMIAPLFNNNGPMANNSVAECCRNAEMQWKFLLWYGVRGNFEEFAMKKASRPDLDSQCELMAEYLSKALKGPVDKKEVALVLELNIKKTFAIHRYEPSGKYKGNIIFFRAKEIVVTSTRQPDDYGISKLLDGKLQVYEVPGNHETVMKGEGAKKIARILRPKLL